VCIWGRGVSSGWEAGLFLNQHEAIMFAIIRFILEMQMITKNSHLTLNSFYCYQEVVIMVKPRQLAKKKIIEFLFMIGVILEHTITIAAFMIGIFSINWLAMKLGLGPSYPVFLLPGDIRICLVGHIYGFCDCRVNLYLQNL